MNQVLDLSIVVPVYNNATSIVKLVEGIDKALYSLEFEIIFVNDCSQDDSMTSIRGISLKYDHIKFRDLPKNIGQHKATLEGIKMTSGNKIVVMDADLQDNPELLPALYEHATSTNHAVFTKRRGMYQSRGRMITSVFIKKVIQLLSGLHFRAGSYYLFDKTIKPNVINMGASCEYPYMSIIVAHAAGELKYVESNRNKRIGTSGYTFFGRIYAAVMAVYCSIYCKLH